MLIRISSSNAKKIGFIRIRIHNPILYTSFLTLNSNSIFFKSASNKDQITNFCDTGPHRYRTDIYLDIDTKAVLKKRHENTV